MVASASERSESHSISETTDFSSLLSGAAALSSWPSSNCVATSLSSPIPEKASRNFRSHIAAAASGVEITLPSSSLRAATRRGPIRFLPLVRRISCHSGVCASQHQLTAMCLVCSDIHATRSLLTRDAASLLVSWKAKICRRMLRLTASSAPHSRSHVAFHTSASESLLALHLASTHLSRRAWRRRTSRKKILLSRP